MTARRQASNRRIVLNARSFIASKAADFRIDSDPVPQPAAGRVRLLMRYRVRLRTRPRSRGEASRMALSRSVVWCPATPPGRRMR